MSRDEMLRTGGWLFAGVLLAVLGWGLAAPAAAQEVPAVPPVPQEAAAEPEEGGGPCDSRDLLMRPACRVIEGVVGGVGSVVQAAGNATLQAMVEWVVETAAWLVGELAGLIDATTSPDVEAGWFDRAYRSMTVVAVALMLPLVLLSIIHAVMGARGAQLARVFGVYIPVATIGMFAATAIVSLLLGATDALSAWVSAAIGADLGTFATSLGSALTATAAPSAGVLVVPGFAALLAGLLVAFSALVIWVLLVLRQAAIYAAVLFMPLAFAGLVWPATSSWFKRLAEGLVAIIFAKLVIVAVVALAASALAAMATANAASEGFALVVAGGSLLLMAVFAPFALLRLIPVLEAQLATALDGVTTSRTSAIPAPNPREMWRQIAAANRARMDAIAPGGVVIAGGAAAAGQWGKSQADNVAGHGSGSGGNPSPPASGSPNGTPGGSNDGGGAGGGAAASPPPATPGTTPPPPPGGPGKPASGGDGTSASPPPPSGAAEPPLSGSSGPTGGQPPPPPPPPGPPKDGDPS